MSKETRDSWWDSGPVYIVFGLVSIFIISTGLFHWPQTDLSVVAAKTSAGFAWLGAILWLGFAALFIGMAIDKLTATLGTVIGAAVLLALSLCSFCGFWYGNY